jgi:4'-phosphopantetheinyl transferase
MTDTAAQYAHDMTEVTLWWVDSADWASSSGGLAALLTEPERGRYARFHRPADALAYACAHSLLHLLVAHTLGAEPGATGLVADPNGKPRLAGIRLPGISLSHSGTLACAALCPTADVGVDLETTLPRPEAARLAKRILSPGEAEEWQSRGSAWHDLMAAWTVKEALLKASGLGISAGMEALHIGAPPPDAGRPQATPASMAPAEGWSYARVMSISGAAAAVAASSLRPLIARCIRIRPGESGMP